MMTKLRPLLLDLHCVFANIGNRLDSLSLTLHNRVKNLGVVFNSELLFDKQINSVKGSFFHLRYITNLNSSSQRRT